MDDAEEEAELPSGSSLIHRSRRGRLKTVSSTGKLPMKPVYRGWRDSNGKKKLTLSISPELIEWAKGNDINISASLEQILRNWKDEQNTKGKA